MIWKREALIDCLDRLELEKRKVKSMPQIVLTQDLILDNSGMKS